MSRAAERPDPVADARVLDGFRRLGAARDLVVALEVAAEIVRLAAGASWAVLIAERGGESPVEIARGISSDDPRVARSRALLPLPLEGRDLELEGGEVAVAIPLALPDVRTAALVAGFADGAAPDDARRELLRLIARQLRAVAERVARAEAFLADPVTGFRSHMGFLLRLLDEWPACEEKGSPVSLILIDVRPADAAEAAPSPRMADAVIRHAASILRDETGEIDLAARQGPWTLEILLPQVGSSWAERIARRIAESIEGGKARGPDGEDVPLRCLVSVATGPEDAGAPDELLEVAAVRLGETSPAVEDAAAADIAEPIEPPVPTGQGRALLEMLSGVLDAGWDLDALLDILVSMLVEILHAERGFVLVRHPHNGFSIESAREKGGAEIADPEKEVSRAIATKVIQTGRPIRIADAGEDPVFADSDSVAGLGLKAVLCVPIQSEGESFGCVYLEHRSDPGRFSARHQDLLSEFARRVSRHLRHTIEFEKRSREVERAARRLEGYSDDSAGKGEVFGIVGRSAGVRQVIELIGKVTPLDLAVHITGESGTGKELVARAIHFEGPRAKRPFVSENCAAIPESIFERELFGHVKGVFTGAATEKPGLIEAAAGGTLFLDEVGELSLGMQAKLLRAIEERGTRRLGGQEWISVDFRLVTASNRSLEDLVAKGKFREDLYYRLEGMTIRLPALRERKEDIPLLVEHFLRREAERDGSPPRRVRRDALSALLRYDWPGNVRELENTIRRGCAIGGEEITARDLPRRLREGTGIRRYLPRERVDGEGVWDSDLLARAIHEAGGNKTEAARRLGISKSTLYARLKRIKDRQEERP